MSKKRKEIFEMPAFEADYPFVVFHNTGKVHYTDHWHHAVEVIMPLDRPMIVDVIGNSYVLNEGDILIIPPCSLHTLRSDDEDGQRAILMFDTQILSVIRGLVNIQNIFTGQKLITAENEPELHNHIRDILQDMIELLHKKEMFYEVNIICKIHELSILIARTKLKDDSSDYSGLIHRRDYAFRLNESIDYINTNYNENITLDSAANAVGFSKYHFARWFKQNAGISFTDYLSKVRIEKAEMLLLDSSKLVTEIAYEVGFQSIVTFNRVFREYAKCTPKEYRSIHQISSLTAIVNDNKDKEDSADTKQDSVNIYKIQPDIKNRYIGEKKPGSARVNENGTFSNPFIWADVPDPDVIRVDDVYYMVSTTMYFSPHCPIMKSYNLVDWEIINYACDILDDSDACTLRSGSSAYGKGSWAASLRYNNGTFYVTTASFTTEKTYIFQTEDIENGPWRRYEIDHVHHDSSLLFDDDGRVYLVSGAGKIYLLELTADATAVKPGGLDCVIIENADAGGNSGLPAEGSHLYKINGYYYLFLIAWPLTGTGRRIELCYRAENILGPYEGRVILDDDIGFKNKGVAQGGIVDTHDGMWYSMLFQDYEAVGRIPVLVPLIWEDGWPVLGESGLVPKNMVMINDRVEVKSIIKSDEFYQCTDEKSYSAVNDIRYLYNNISDEPILGIDYIVHKLLINGDFINDLYEWASHDIAHLQVVSDDMFKLADEETGITHNKPVLKVYDRLVTSSGPKQTLSGKVFPGGVYEVSARIRYDEGPHEKQFLISISRGEGWETIQNMTAGNVTKGEWCDIKGTYTLPVDSDLNNPFIFVETPWVEKPKKDDDLMDFYVESISMTEKPLLWKTKTAAFENDSNGSVLPPEWQWNHNPDNNLWSLIERPGYLRLKSGYMCHELASARNTLTQRTFGPVCTCTTALDTKNMNDGDFAGIAALQDEYGFIGVRINNGYGHIVMVSKSTGLPEVIESIPLDTARIYFRIDFDFTDTVDKAGFYYSNDEINWHHLGDDLLMKYKLTHFTGYRAALFYFSTQTVGGYADFDYFRICRKPADNYEDITILSASFDPVTEVLGVPNEIINLSIRMDRLSCSSCKGIFISLPVPLCFDLEDVIFNSENIIGETSYEFNNRCLQLQVTGDDVSFCAGEISGDEIDISCLFASINLKVNNYVSEDTLINITVDYIHAETTPQIIYDTHKMNAEIQLKAVKTKAKAKLLGFANPLIDHKYGADPWVLEYNGRIYMYLTADAYEFNERGKLINNTYGKINKITVLSSSDLINWTDHGEIPVAGPEGIAKWAAHSWAPAVAVKKIDGEDRFYLYFSNNGSNIGVLQGESPTGPWIDPLGEPVIHRDIPGAEGTVWCFDPAVLVDDDGKAYMFFGGGLSSQDQEAALHPKTARVIELGEDMITTVGTAAVIDSPAHFESAGINKIGDKYYYSYCSNFVGEHPKSYPGYGEIAYMTADSPMGPYKYMGVVLKNPEYFFGTGGNNHHCIFTFKNQMYIAYHAQTLGKALGREKGYRSPHINKVNVTKDGRIRPVAADMEGVKLCVPVNPYKQIDAVFFAWQSGIGVSASPGTAGLCITDVHDGDWVAVANVDFGAAGAVSFFAVLSSPAGGEIEIRLESPKGAVIGRLGVGATGGYDKWDEFICDIINTTGIHNLFFVFKGDYPGSRFNFKSWRFELGTQRDDSPGLST